MRLFSATLATETNTFSPLPTSLAAYEEAVFLRPGEHPDDAPRMCTAPLFVARRRAAAEGFTLIEGSCFAASPAGTTNGRDYELMRDEILAQLQAAMPLDGVLLGLHGAMVAHGYDDVEGDIIERVRAIVGPGCMIGVELDPHCHMTLKRVRLADVIVCYKEFPHTDVVERAEDLLELVLGTLRGKIKPVMSLYDCRQISSYPTTLPLMRAFVDRIKAMEGKDGILSISIVHCFPYADVPELTSRVLVVTDNDKAEGRRAREPARRGARLDARQDHAGILRGRRRRRRSLGVRWPAGGARRAGGQRRRRRAVRQHRDPAPPDRAEGRGGRARPDLGSDRRPPVLRRRDGRDIPAALRRQDRRRPPACRSMRLVEVVGLARDCWQSFGPTRVPLGDCAAVRVGGVEVVLITKRTQALGLELFTNLGIDPRSRRLVVVKSTNHFMGAYGPIAKKVIYVESGGPLTRDYRKIPYTRVDRPIWPLDEATSPGLIF